MLFATGTLALFASASHIHAQELNINNYCDKDVYFWDVGTDISPPSVVPLDDFRQIYLEPDPVSKGKDVFISWTNSSDISQPTLHFSYNVDGNWQVRGHVLWYAMSNINGVPFKGHKLRIDGPSCPNVKWVDGQGDTGVKSCPDAQFMDLGLCVER